MRIKNNVNVAISSTDNFNVYLSSAAASWNNFTVVPTSLWGDGLTTASETAGTKINYAKFNVSKSSYSPW